MSRRAQGKYAYGFCDRTGQRWPLHELREELVQGRRTGLRVGPDVWDPDHPQNFLGKLKIALPDPQALRHPRPDLSQQEARNLSSFDPVGVGNIGMVSNLNTAKVVIG